MKIKSYIKVAIAIAAIGILVIAILMGFVPGLESGFLNGNAQIAETVTETIADNSGGLSDCDYPDRDIYTALCGLSGKSLSYVETITYIRALDLTLCGVDDRTPNEVTTLFTTAYEEQGFTLQLNQLVGSTYWSGYLTLWSHNNIFYGLITGAGASVDAVFGMDCMFLHGKGTQADWQAFLVWITA